MQQQGRSIMLLFLTRYFTSYISVTSNLRLESTFGFSAFLLHRQHFCERGNMQKGKNDMGICPCESHVQDAECF